jgi:large subunit ribosomal protein L6
MSRLIKKPIAIPAGVTVSKNGGLLTVKGLKSERQITLPAAINVKVETDAIRIESRGGLKRERAIPGTTWSLVKSAIEGVSKGFSKILEIEGVGYRANTEGDTLILSLGYVEPVRFKVPAGVDIAVSKNTITISGNNKELVGRVAAQIRHLKKPEPYKGKGIRYRGEVIKRKVGKKAVVTAG